MSKNIIDSNNHKFGVEIELTGITREKAAKIISDYFVSKPEVLKEVPPKTELYKDQFGIKDTQNKEWKIVCDKSINANKENEKVELVTPILTIKEIDKLKEITSRFQKAGAKADPSCGIHIHIDASIHTPESVTCLINSIGNIQTFLSGVFGIHNVRKKFCYDLPYSSLSLFKQIQPKSLSQIRSNLFEKHQIVNFSNMSDDKNAPKNTIEFRLFNSTLDGQKIEAYIHFALSLSLYSLNKNKLLPQSLRIFAMQDKKYRKEVKSKSNDMFNTLNMPKKSINVLTHDLI